MHTSFLVAVQELWYYHDWDKQFLFCILVFPRFQKVLYIIKIPKRAHVRLEFQKEVKSSGFSSTTPLQIKVFGAAQLKYTPMNLRHPYNYNLTSRIPKPSWSKVSQIHPRRAQKISRLETSTQNHQHVVFCFKGIYWVELRNFKVCICIFVASC